MASTKTCHFSRFSHTIGGISPNTPHAVCEEHRVPCTEKNNLILKNYDHNNHINYIFFLKTMCILSDITNAKIFAHKNVKLSPDSPMNTVNN